MPELPEVETVCRGLNELTRDRAIAGGEVLLPRTIAYPDSITSFLAGVTGVTIARWHRRGKYLLAELQPEGGWLGVHLRMTGQLLWTKQTAPLQKHARVRLFFNQGQELRFVDTRTFGKMWWVPPHFPPEAIIAGLQTLGVEPFSAEFTPDYLAEKLRKSQRPIKTALLDQSVLAGLGNIYADEALFLSGIRPDAIASRLSPQQLQHLHRAIIEVLQTSIDKGGTTFSDFLNPLGVNGNYGGVAWVYGRTRQPCRRCQTPIERLKLAGRSTHYCPQCQN
ncbi:DNA-formamidopyrimidine glycosylase [Oscillatoria sp. FACHB-1406]|uniref:DNA-formamidopyrimidine glycosylase n=1 Tax=Oscillatoria sp. FACHB-1406 TaxID=2692846 RepID=UPI00168469E1|nr:DNA-formamidopyrimidine glycosylase [Oscillatoria sp. FACHB-1406]MBD2576904.1 DNA-formamidopyrimidine glycosylase [Oscillatoria sp. FACHB-1406]